MSETSPILGLPYIQPSQAQKHVIHNEAVQSLDLVTQLVVESFGAETAPGVAQEGLVYALGADPVGSWAGHANELATWRSSYWAFVSPKAGWRAWSKDSQELRIWDGSDWKLPEVGMQNLDSVGIGTQSDSQNRLAVKSPYTLLTHEGSGHQLKINKAASGDTASLLFQTEWSGRAEMGTTGSDSFGIKVSADGSNWFTGVRVEAASGQVTLPQGAEIDGAVSGLAVQQSADDVTAGRLMRADWGYGPGNVLGAVSETGGVPTGAVVERGSNANGAYTRFADGTQICMLRKSGIPITTAIGGLYCSSPFRWTFPAAFVSGDTSGANVYGRVKDDAGISVNAPYDNRTTEASDIKAFASSSVSGTAVYLTATGRWF